MAILWVKDEEARWAVLELERGPYELTTGGELPLRLVPRVGAGAAVIVACDGPGGPAASGGAGGDEWALVSGRADVRLNGFPLSAASIRVLRDRDEVCLAGAEPLFFSKERLARVEPFPMDGTVCPRCRTPILNGRPSVRCPNPRCGVWHHEDEESGFQCWTYADECASELCRQPTALSEEFDWTPEDHC